MPAATLAAYQHAGGVWILGVVAGSAAMNDHVIQIGKTFTYGGDADFGLRVEDARQHTYLIGKTGSGKTTLLRNLILQHIAAGHGVALLDPHGDLADELLDHFPPARADDLVYFNPADTDYPIVINPLEVTNKEEAELVVSGIVSIFNKIFGFSWGPRLEYILRNSLSTLAQVPDSTLKDVPLLLTNKSFRTKIAKFYQPISYTTRTCS